MFRVVIETDNAAFDECPEIELCEILAKLSDKVAQESSLATVAVLSIPILDTNGNRVGRALYDSLPDPADGLRRVAEIVADGHPYLVTMTRLREVLGDHGYEETS